MTRRTSFNDLPLAVKIGTLLGLFAAVAVGLTALATVRLWSLSDEQDVMYKQSSVPMDDLVKATRQVGRLRAFVTGLPSWEPADQAKAIAELDTQKGATQDAINTYLPSVRDQANTDAIKTNLASYLDSVGKVESAVQAGDMATARALTVGDMRATVTSLNDALASEAELQAQASSDLNDAGTAIARSATWLLWIVLSVAIAAVMAMALYVIRSIKRAVNEMNSSIEALAAGDLTRTPQVKERDELGQMAENLARAQEQVRGVIETVVTTAAAVAASAEELSAAGAQVASGSEETSAQAGVVAAAAE
ncbi:MCP four helix bundle domain-containing protein, partial [Cellulomonas citrea]|uniref:MCP four helix bundle domain-containing protein n=1 Tax=Cellulomonas citrea TaxID=1909423 RepID=UPI00135942FF